MKRNIDRKKLPCKLLVEGKDDLYVTAGIRDRHQLPDNFEIIDCEGVDKMPDQLISQITLQRPRIDAVGIMLDADSNPIGRWNSVRDILLKEGYIVQTSPDSNGTVIEGEGRNPTIGIWLMPDNLQTGMLEDFVRFLIPLDNPLSPLITRILSEVEAQDHTYRYSPDTDRAKAFIHTWLAWQKEPGKPMGTAITATYLDHNTELCLRFVAWLNRLFNA